MYIDHLDGGELLKSTARSQSRRQCMQSALQRDLETISQERDEDVGFDPARPDGRSAVWPDRPSGS
jgi:hypothetical protein